MMVLEWFLQDHVTLKTGQTAAEKSALHHRYILFIKYKYIEIETIILFVLIFHNITVLPFFKSKVSTRHFFQKHKKLPIPYIWMVV